jgi:hypothetical protein
LIEMRQQSKSPPLLLCVLGAPLHVHNVLACGAKELVALHQLAADTAEPNLQQKLPDG